MRTISYQDIGPLFDFLEHCMVTVVFSFQAIEAYCNHVIGSKLKGTYQLPRGKEKKILEASATEVERLASTEEKVGTIVPKLLGRKGTPKGTKTWESFRDLKSARDAATHLKAAEQYPLEPQKGGPFFYRLLHTDARQFPVWAIDVLTYFEGSNPPRWFLQPLLFRRQLGTLPKPTGP